MHPLVLLLFSPAALLLLVAGYHLRPALAAAVHSLNRRLRSQLPRAAFGLPPHPRRLSVRATTFLALCAGAGISLASGSTYLVLVTGYNSPAHPKSLNNFPTSYPSAHLATAFLSGSLALPTTCVLLSSVSVFLRQAPDSRFARVLRRLLGGEPHLTHAAVLRASLLSAISMAGIVAICAIFSSQAWIILLTIGGTQSAAAFGIGAIAWRSRMGSGREALGAKIESAAAYAAAVSFARKSRDALRSATTSANTSADSGNTSGETGDTSYFDFEHVQRPTMGETYHSTPHAARAEVERARAELAAAQAGQRTPHGSWKPPCGSPSSWVSERRRSSGTLPEWDFRGSLSLGRAHRRNSSSFTSRTLAALGLGVDRVDRTNTTDETYRTARTTARPSNVGVGHNPTSSTSSSVHTRPNRDSAPPMPGSGQSTRPDGSIVGIVVPDPFDPLPPINFSSITKLSMPRSVGLGSTSGEAMTSVLAGLGDARTLTLVDHGDTVAVHNYSETSSSGLSLALRPSAEVNLPRMRPLGNLNSGAMRSTRSVNTMPTIHSAPTSPWDASAERLQVPSSQPSPWASWGELGESEWVAVEAPSVSESYRRADGICGILGVLGLVICFALTAPLLALGAHPATLTIFGVALGLPAPFLAAASFFTRSTPSVHNMTSSGSARTAAPVSMYRDSTYRSVDFARIDYSQPRWSAGPVHPSAVAGGSLGSGRNNSLRGGSSQAHLNPQPSASEPGGPRVPPPPPRVLRASFAPHRPHVTNSELLKPKPRLSVAHFRNPSLPRRDRQDRDKISRHRGGVVSICVAEVASRLLHRDTSFSGDEAAFVSLDMTPPLPMEDAEICTGRAVRLTSRCPSVVDLNDRSGSSTAGGGGGIRFSDSLQAVLVDRLTRRRTLDASEASYRVDSYCEGAAQAPGRRGVILRSVGPNSNLNLEDPNRDVTILSEGEGESCVPRVSSSSFNPVRASTPLGYNGPKGSSTTNGTTMMDPSFDWNNVFLPPNPPLPEEYCGLAYAPHSVSHAPSTRVDSEEAARASEEAETSIQASAGWMHLVDGQWTPAKSVKSHAAAASIKSSKSPKSAKSARNVTFKDESTLPLGNTTDSPHRPSTWSHATAPSNAFSSMSLSSDPQTPSLVRMCAHTLQRDMRPLAALPPLPALTPPPPLPPSMTRHAPIPTGTAPWLPGVRSLTAPRRREPPNVTAPLSIAPRVPPPPYSSPIPPQQVMEPATPQRAQIQRTSRPTSSFSVTHSRGPMEITKAIGAVASYERIEAQSSTGPLRTLKLVERAARRNSLRDSVSEQRSQWTEGTSRFADADESFPQVEVEHPVEHGIATFGRHHLRANASVPSLSASLSLAQAQEPAPEHPVEHGTATFGRHHLRANASVPSLSANLSLTQAQEPAPEEPEKEEEAPPRPSSTPPHKAPAPTNIPRLKSYSSLRAARSSAEREATIASLRAFSLTSSPSQSQSLDKMEEVAPAPIGAALRRPRTSNTAIVFADISNSTSTSNSNSQSRSKMSDANNSHNHSKSHSSKMSTGSTRSMSSVLGDKTNTRISAGPRLSAGPARLSGGPPKLNRLSAEPDLDSVSEINDTNICARKAGGPRPLGHTSTTTKTSAASMDHSVSRVAEKDKENDPAAGVRTGRGRKRGSTGPHTATGPLSGRQLVPRI